MPPSPDAPLVSVFRTAESDLLALAKMALDEEAIEYDVRDPGLNREIVGYRQASGASAIDVPSEILVRAEDAARARDRLSDLATGMPVAVEIPPPAAGEGDESSRGETLAPTVDLVDNETGRSLGRIDETQLAWLADRLERESADDQDYYIDRPTLEMLADQGADAALVDTLTRALGGRENMTVRWSRG
jgi:hypothetical protein